MDKYEFNIKVEQIKKLAAKKSYKEAAAIAKDMNWQKVKDWSTLATVINVQEAVGDYMEARDMAILAYNRNLGGRKLVYKLTELFIKLKDFENADSLYEEYEKASQHDVNRFILYFDLRKAEQASDNELVEILEDYKEHEIDEKYMYELAKLYYKTGRIEECVKTIDDVVLWFQDGIYVEKSIKLKQDTGAVLTSIQKKILDDAISRKEDLEMTRELQFMEQQELVRMQHDDIEDELKADEDYNSTDDDNIEDTDLDLLSDSDETDEFEAQWDDESKDVKDSDDDNDEDDGSSGAGVVGGLKSFLKKAFTGSEEEDEDDDDSEEDESDIIDHSANSIDLSQLSDDDDDVISEIFNKKDNKPAEDDKVVKTDANGVKTTSQTTASVVDTAVKTAAGAAGMAAAGVAVAAAVKSHDAASKSDSSAERIDKASMSLKELIENAKKKIEDSYDQINREEEEERLAKEKLEEEVREAEAKRIEEQKAEEAKKAADEQRRLSEEQAKQEREEARRQMKAREDAMEIEVKVPNFNLYDTQNIQAALAANLSEMLKDDDDVDALRPQPVADDKNDSNVSDAEVEEDVQHVDDQIEGQLSLADWIETVREEKYGRQNTREFSKVELDRMLDEKDEKSAAYEKLIAEQKAKAEAAGTEFDEEEAKRAANAQMMINAAKTDLAIRTGKATLKQEEAVEAILKEAVKSSESETEEPEIESAQDEPEIVSLNTATFAPITDEILSSVKEIMDEDRVDAVAAGLAAGAAETVASATFEAAADIAAEDITDDEADDQQYDLEDADDYTDDNNYQDEPEGRKMQPVARVEEDSVDDMDEEQEENKKLTGDLAKIFRKYREMPGLESQLVNLFNEIDAEMDMTTSERGNIIISGNSSSDKTDLARTIVRALNYIYQDNPKKIAKTTGDSINHRGISKAMAKLKGTALIVESAGSIQPKRINELLGCLDQDTDRMIVIFEDSDAEINVLMNFNPELANKFNHRIILKQYTVNELVEMARKFARKRQFEVDDDALLELYLKIDRLHSMNDNIKLDDIKDIINSAIVRSEKRSSRKLFGGLKKKKGAKGDVVFLTEADFQD